MSSKQYGLKAGLKVFKGGGLQAVSSNINDNLHGRGVIEPEPSLQVTAKIQKASLPYLMFLKQKRCRKTRPEVVLMAGSNANLSLRKKPHHRRYPHTPS